MNYSFLLSVIFWYGQIVLFCREEIACLYTLYIALLLVKRNDDGIAQFLLWSPCISPRFVSRHV